MNGKRYRDIMLRRYCVAKVPLLLLAWRPQSKNKVCLAFIWYGYIFTCNTYIAKISGTAQPSLLPVCEISADSQSQSHSRGYNTLTFIAHSTVFLGYRDIDRAQSRLLLFQITVHSHYYCLATRTEFFSFIKIPTAQHGYSRCLSMAI